MAYSKKTTGLFLLIAMVGVGAVLYFGFFKTAPQAASADTKGKTSRAPDEHILGLDKQKAESPVTLDAFMKSEYEVQNAECKKQTPGAELAMGVTKAVRDSFASVSLGCGDTGTTGYYAKVNGTWQIVFKAEDTPTCDQVNKVKFTKEIIPECAMGVDNISDNTNP